MYLSVINIMPGPTEIVATCRKAVITGVSGEPEWSELCDKLTFLRYAERWCEATSKGVFVVFAHAQTPLRKAGWMKLFPGAETVEKVSEFEDCELYRDLKRRGALKTLGDPPPKEAVVSKNNNKHDNSFKAPRKAFAAQNSPYDRPGATETTTATTTEKAIEHDRSVWRHDLSNLRIQRLELEQQNPQDTRLQSLDAAICQREQQLAGREAPRSETGKYWQCKVRPVRGKAMWDWSKMKQGEEGWRMHYRNHRCYKVAYLAWPEGADYAWVVGTDAMTLAGWQQVYADMVVSDDIEDIQDLNMVQEACSMIERGEVVHEVGAWAELRFKGADGAAQRAALTLAAQRVGPLPQPSNEEMLQLVERKVAVFRRHLKSGQILKK